MATSEVVTRGVRVGAESQYIPERSDPAKGLFFFAYQITIANEGTASVQLMSRHWIITDAEGRVEEVEGPGVIGEQPVIEPGEQHQYTSFCPLPTSSGSMHGTYQMVAEDGASFDAQIAPFRLSLPGETLH